MYRFRNRTIKLLTLSAVFCAMFVSGLYLAETYALNADIEAQTTASYILDFHNGIPESAASYIESVKGIRAVYGDYRSIRTSRLTSHVLVHKSDTNALCGLHTYSKNGEYYAETDFAYIAADSEDVLYRFADFYRIEGDPACVLTEPNTIMIGVSKNNRNVYDFAVGDKIAIAVLEAPIHEQLSENLSGYALLDAQIDAFPYRYITLTVGAVLYDYPSALYGTPIVMATDVFDELLNVENSALAPAETTSVTTDVILPEEPIVTTAAEVGTAPLHAAGSAEISDSDAIDPPAAEPITVTKSNRLYVFLKEGLTGRDVDKVESALRDIATAYKTVSVTATGTYHDGAIRESRQYGALLSTLAICLLLFVPILWFFTQILFYNRRSTEFDILLSIAADMRHIRRLHTADSILLGITALLALPFSALCTYLINTFFTLIMPMYVKYGTEIVAQPLFDPIPYLLCMALTILCSMLSALIPFAIYKCKKRKAEKELPPSADI